MIRGRLQPGVRISAEGELLYSAAWLDDALTGRADNPVERFTSEESFRAETDSSALTVSALKIEVDRRRRAQVAADFQRPGGRRAEMPGTRKQKP